MASVIAITMRPKCARQRHRLSPMIPEGLAASRAATPIGWSPLVLIDRMDYSRPAPRNCA